MIEVLRTSFSLLLLLASLGISLITLLGTALGMAVVRSLCEEAQAEASIVERLEETCYKDPVTANSYDFVVSECFDQGPQKPCGLSLPVVHIEESGQLEVSYIGL